MAVEVQAPLPPLRRKIRRSFSVLIASYVLVGTFLVLSVFLASGITPKLIHVNYDSIAASHQMREAWNALQNPRLYPRRKDGEWATQFENALRFEESNVSEPGEGEIARGIRQLWNQTGPAPERVDAATFAKMTGLLDGLVSVNEQGMFNLAADSTMFGRKVFIASILLFLITLVLTILLSDGLAVRLARPIKEIAEALRSDPGLDRRLKLPKPTSLEMRILTKEIGELWDRLRSLQKLNLEELEAERERLETVLTSVEDAVLVLDNQSRIIQVSEGMLRILALRSEEGLGHPWPDLPTAGENYLKLRAYLKPDLPADNMIELAVDDKRLVFAARSRAIDTDHGQRIGLVYLLHDITELRQRERLKTEFIGVLSHELKTPLQSLGTAAESLATRKAGFDDDTKVLVDTVNEDVARIRAVANDFVQVSVVDLHSLKLKIERLPLSQLLQDWLKPFRILARDKDVRLEFEKTGSDVIWANVDMIKFPWAVSNLIANAIRVSEAGHTVTVSISDRVSTEYLKIDISDEGPGIPPEIQSRMFEPYYQAPKGTSGAASGFLGLGLTIAKEVVEAHEGRIEYLSNSPRGSIFRITLPSVGVII